MTGRVCQSCAGPIPDEKQKGAKYCCSQCRSQHWYVSNRDKMLQRNRQWYAANRDKVRAYEKVNKPEYHLRHKYGMTSEDYDWLMMDQQGVCAICFGGSPDASERLQIDHDHDTGKVRGLLCGNCNRALGSFKDDLDNLASAISYLQTATPSVASTHQEV